MHFAIRSRVSGVNGIQSKRLGNAKIAVAGALVCLACGQAATAAPLTGSMAVVVNPFAASSASFTASSLTLNAVNVITTAAQGDFATQIPALSDLTANTTKITGLSATPLADSIANFFAFSSPDATLATSGTTPVNRFDFNLATITETSSNVGLGIATFDGTGTIVDSLGAFDPTPAAFTVSFSSPNNYSFTIAAVPEPATLGLITTGLLGTLSLRRRRVAR